MEIDENAPGNISQCPATRTTDNETGFDSNTQVENEPMRPARPQVDERPAPVPERAS